MITKTEPMSSHTTSRGQGGSRNVERRSRERVLLHCPLRLYKRGSRTPIEGETLNLSSAGFYCVVRVKFEPGDSLDCILTVPAENVSVDAGSANLHCEVFVTRIEPRSSDYGVACRIDHYSLILRSDQTS